MAACQSHSRDLERHRFGAEYRLDRSRRLLGHEGYSPPHRHCDRTRIAGTPTNARIVGALDAFATRIRNREVRARTRAARRARWSFGGDQDGSRAVAVEIE